MPAPWLPTRDGDMGIMVQMERSANHTANPRKTQTAESKPHLPLFVSPGQTGRVAGFVVIEAHTI